MKRLLIAVVLVLFGCCHVMAQKPSEAETFEILNQALDLYGQGNYQKALDGFLEIGECTRKQSNEDERQAYVYCLTKAVECHEKLEQYKQAFQLSEGLLESAVYDSEKKEIQSLYVRNGWSWLRALSIIEEPATARAVLTKIKPFADEEMSQSIGLFLPMTWLSEGELYEEEQNYQQALPCLETACLGFHEAGDVQYELDSRNQIGYVKQMLCDVKGSLEAYKQAETLAKKHEGKEKAQLEALEGQLSIYGQLGDNESIVETRSKIASLAETSENDELEFEINRFLGKEALKQGQSKLAELYFLKNKAYVDGLGEDYRGSARILYYQSLRDLCLDTERLDDALKYQFLIKNETRGYPDYLYYVLLSQIYEQKGDSVSCFQVLDTLFTYQRMFSEPREEIQLYVVSGTCHTTFGDYESALADYRNADELLAGKYDENDVDRVNLLALMGGVELRMKHFKEAERLFRNYLEGMERLVGEEHIDYIDGLYHLANAEAFAGHIDAACNDYSLAVAKLKHQIQGKLPFLTSLQREGYWKSVSKLLQKMTSFALKLEQYQTSFTQSCYESLLLSKGFLLATERSVFDLIKDKGTVDDLNDFAAIADLEAQVRKWEKEAGKHVDSILLFTSLIRSKETELASHCRAFGDITAFMDWDYQDVKSKLCENEVFIDFADFLSVTDDRERIYAAYVINSKQEYPLVKRLFDECSIDSSLIANPDMFYDTLFSAEAYRLLWKPFESEVKEGGTVYYVPSQLLFQVALESVPLHDGTLLGDHYRFVRLSSARELASFVDKLDLQAVEGRPTAVLYGGLQYDVEADVMAAEAKRYGLPQMLAVLGGEKRGDSLFCELPWSRVEVDSIVKIFEKLDLPVLPYTEAQGTEESFRNLDGNTPQILHIATHGFYYTPEKAKEVEYLRGFEDPMLLSGLVMSGGNAAWLGHELPDGVLDGILTANDIARLDLSGVDLAVLCACQSGNGKATSEGLYGLQRAFKKAGVKTVVMSLWDVQDRVGSEFMIAFYESLLGETKGDVRKALDAAKSRIREVYHEPYCWAGFVVLD